jgi:hypothetical protein
MAYVLSRPVEVWADSGVTESYQNWQPKATVVYTCAAQDRFALVADLVGTSVRAGNAIVRTFPFRYPASPNLMCTSIDGIEFYGKPMIDPIGGAPYLVRSRCRVTATFTPPLFNEGNADPSGLPYTTTSVSLGGEFVTLPDTTYKFPSGWPTSTPVGLFIPTAQVEMRRHMMPYVPVGQVFPLIGAVNLDAVSVGGFSCAAGTLLFQGFSSTITADALGNITYDVSYQFSYRYRPWNQFLSPNPTEGWAVVTDGNGNPVYPTADFSQIP